MPLHSATPLLIFILTAVAVAVMAWAPDHGFAAVGGFLFGLAAALSILAAARGVDKADD